MRANFRSATLVAAAITLSAPAKAESIIDFDDAPAGLTSSNFYASQGVSFASGSISDTIAVGGLINFSERNNQYFVLGVNAITPTNLAVAADFATLGSSSLQDTLISLATPATNISVDLDDARSSDPGADIVRLIALEATSTPDLFRVAAFTQALDNLPTLTTLTVSSATPFSFAIFQVTTELEGFDNLRITSIPEPSSVALLGTGVGLLGLLSARGGRRRRASIGRVQQSPEIRTSRDRV